MIQEYTKDAEVLRYVSLFVIISLKWLYFSIIVDEKIISFISICLYLSSFVKLYYDISTWLVKAWSAIDRLLVIWKSDLSDKIKCNFFQAAVVSILLYGCTTWTLTRCIEKKLDSSCARILQAMLNKSWKQHSTKQQLYSYLPPISKTIQIRQTRHVGHF